MEAESGKNGEMIMIQRVFIKVLPGERGVEAEVGERGDDQDEESPERSDRTLEDFSLI